MNVMAWERFEVYVTRTFYGIFEEEDQKFYPVSLWPSLDGISSLCIDKHTIKVTTAAGGVTICDLLTANL
jgi:hypothetical protein